MLIEIQQIKQKSKPKMTTMFKEAFSIILFEILLIQSFSFFSNAAISCPEGFTGDSCEIECGLTFTENVTNPKHSSFWKYHTPRIVNGRNAKPGAWPAQAFIKACYGGSFYLNKFNVTVNRSECFQCGGTLIDKTTVLTAAHCLLNRFEFTYKRVMFRFPIFANDKFPTNESIYEVWLGLHNLATINKAEISPVVKMSVSRITMNENYDQNTLRNDIAILKLSEPVTLSEKIQVACLPKTQTTSYPPVNEHVWTIGWGVFSGDGIFRNVLQEGNIAVLNPNIYCDCYKKISLMNWDSQICASDPKKRVDSCQGESGGPLYILDNVAGKEKFVLSGITSYGEGCASRNFPGVYTRVSNFLSWISENK